MAASKTKTVRAWAVIDAETGKTYEQNSFGHILIFDKRKDFKTFQLMHGHIGDDSVGVFRSKCVVPCTITYTIPTKGKRNAK